MSPFKAMRVWGPKAKALVAALASGPLWGGEIGARFGIPHNVRGGLLRRLERKGLIRSIKSRRLHGPFSERLWAAPGQPVFWKRRWAVSTREGR